MTPATPWPLPAFVIFPWTVNENSGFFSLLQDQIKSSKEQKDENRDIRSIFKFKLYFSRMNHMTLPQVMTAPVMVLLLVLLNFHNINDVEAQTTLFKNFIICDGTGNAMYTGDVRIRDNYIALIGNLIPRYGEQVIDGRHRLILAPGFIDTHSHHDRNLEDTTQYSSFLNQGITTLIVGQDGSSHLPLSSYFEERIRGGLPVNLGSYIGHNTLRYQAMGNEDFKRNASAGEIKQMKKLLKQELKSGALGLSTGLEYDPGIYSSRDEVMQLALVAARRDGRYMSHLRSEDIELESAIDEILAIGKRTKMPVQISHLKIAMKSKWGQAETLLRKLDAAREQGILVTADIYPYDFWLSTLEVQFPKRDFENKASAEYALRELTPPDGMILARYDAIPEYVGKSIAQIAWQRKEDPADTYMYLIRLAHEKNADEQVMGRSMTEPDIIELMQWPYTNFCSDGFGGGRHPRGVASFPRVLNHYVKALKVMDFERAIFKMTGLSAANLGLERRGKISTGYFADLVIIDTAAITDRASLSSPFELSKGIEQVWVNGKNVWNQEAFTGQLPGQILKRKPE